MIVTISFFDIILLVVLGLVLVLAVIGHIMGKVSRKVSRKPKYISVEPAEPPEWAKRQKAYDDAVKAEKARLKALKASDRDAYRKETGVRRHFLIFISIFGVIFAGLIAALILTHIQK